MKERNNITDMEKREREKKKKNYSIRERENRDVKKIHSTHPVMTDRLSVRE